MFFRKKIQPSCSYCVHAARLSDGQILCAKRGLVTAEGKCMRFRYDPIKRVPLKAKALDFEKYDQDDFSL